MAAGVRPAPPQPFKVTEHEVYACQCGPCSHIISAAFPEGETVPAQYGPRIAALSAYLQKNGRFLPDRARCGTRSGPKAP